jgi:hypothetical protein
MPAFFTELDKLQEVYRGRDWSVEAWWADIEQHLSLIDTLLPVYAQTVESDRATAALRDRELLPAYTIETDPEFLRDIALRVASLFQGALSKAQPPSASPPFN